MIPISPSRLPEMPLLPPLEVAFPQGQLSGEKGTAPAGPLGYIHSSPTRQQVLKPLPSSSPSSHTISGRLPVPNSLARTQFRVENSPRKREQPERLALLHSDTLSGLSLPQLSPSGPQIGAGPQGTLSPPSPASGPKGRLSPSGLTHLNLTHSPVTQVHKSEVFQDTHLHTHHSSAGGGVSLEPLVGHLSRISRGIDALVKARPPEKSAISVGPIKIPHKLNL